MLAVFAGAGTVAAFAPASLTVVASAGLRKKAGNGGSGTVIPLAAMALSEPHKTAQAKPMRANNGAVVAFTRSLRVVLSSTHRTRVAAFQIADKTKMRGWACGSWRRVAAAMLNGRSGWPPAHVIVSRGD